MFAIIGTIGAKRKKCAPNSYQIVQKLLRRQPLEASADARIVNHLAPLLFSSLNAGAPPVEQDVKQHEHGDGAGEA
jgi:hypothetical protein